MPVVVPDDFGAGQRRVALIRAHPATPRSCRGAPRSPTTCRSCRLRSFVFTCLRKPFSALLFEPFTLIGVFPALICEGFEMFIFLSNFELLELHPLEVHLDLCLSALIFALNDYFNELIMRVGALPKESHARVLFPRRTVVKQFWFLNMQAMHTAE